MDLGEGERALLRDGARLPFWRLIVRILESRRAAAVERLVVAAPAEVSALQGEIRAIDGLITLPEAEVEWSAAQAGHIHAGESSSHKG